MVKKSAGLLMYRYRDGQIEVLLAHMGGPYWANKDLGAWSLPKGEYEPEEDPLAAARREFQEELGFAAVGQFVPLQARKQPSGKVISAWAFEGDWDPGKIVSNTFSMEWPPRSGKFEDFPEVDRAAWLPLELARQKILKGQRPFLDELEHCLSTKSMRANDARRDTTKA